MSENNWPDPSPEMLNGDPLFDAIWGVIKSWDINVSAIYSGYCGATGNHARAIRDAIGPCLTPAEVDARVSEARRVALEDCAKWHDEVASEYKKEQLLYEAKDSWTVAYVFAQGYVINNKRAATIRALGEKE
jgi:hypothetical protein